MATKSITALAGGVGAARFLRGLVRVVPPESITVVVNTGDDETFHGLRVCPDLDSVTYTLAGEANPETGWGLAGETFASMEALARFGVPTWFRLGDRDLATHLYRTDRLRQGATLSEVTAEIGRAFGLGVRLLPMSDEPAPTWILAADGRRLAMQEWFVEHHAEPAVSGVDLSPASAVSPASGVLDAVRDADVVVLCPSNPVISVGPILAVPGVRAALAARRERVVGVSPLLGGKPVRGPADRLLAGIGVEVSSAGVAAMYADVCATFLVDDVDRGLAPAIEALGVKPVVGPILMPDEEAAASLAKRAIDALAL